MSAAPSTSGAELRSYGQRIAEVLHERYPDCTEDEFVAALKAQDRTIRRMAGCASDPQAARDEIEAAALARWRELRRAS